MQAYHAGPRSRAIPPVRGGGSGRSSETLSSRPHVSDYAEEGVELPEGIDAREAEEARMLEAALLGVPYEGQMPDFSSRLGIVRKLVWPFGSWGL
jgi:hypothetical protein